MTDETRIIDTVNPGVATEQPIITMETQPTMPITPITTDVSGDTPNNKRFTARINDPCTIVKSDAEVFSGLAAYESFTVEILDNGKYYLSGQCSIWRLNEQNTVPANRFLQALADDKSVVVDHDVKVTDFPLPPKVQFILDKLNA